MSQNTKKKIPYLLGSIKVSTIWDNKKEIQEWCVILFPQEKNHRERVA